LLNQLAVYPNGDSAKANVLARGRVSRRRSMSAASA
jgi:hypothetical protein